MAHTQGKLFFSPDYKQIHADNGEKETWERNTICDIRGDYENRKADAERIVTTWNEYDQLKEAVSYAEKVAFETSKKNADLMAELEASKEREGKLRELCKNSLSYFADLTGSEWIKGDGPGESDMIQRAASLQASLYKALNQ